MSRRFVLLSFIAYLIAAAATTAWIHTHGFLGFSHGFRNLDKRVRGGEAPVHEVLFYPGASHLLDSDRITKISSFTGKELEDLRTGDFVRVEFRRDGEPHAIVLPLTSQFRSEGAVFVFFMPMLGHVVMIGIALLAAWSRRDDLAQHYFGRIALTLGASGLLFVWLIYVQQRGLWPWYAYPANLIGFVQMWLVLGFLMPSLAMFTLRFPSESPALRRYPAVRAWLFGSHTLLVALPFVPELLHHTWHYVKWSHSQAVVNTIFGAIGLGVIATQIVLARRWRRRQWLRHRSATPVATLVQLFVVLVIAAWFPFSLTDHGSTIQTALQQPVPYVLLGLLTVDVLFFLILFVVRYRRASAPDRLRMRWIVWGVLMLGAGVATLNATIIIADRSLSDIASGNLEPRVAAVMIASIVIIPLSFLFTVFRYALWAADAVIRTTVFFLTWVCVSQGLQFATQQNLMAWLELEDGSWRRSVEFAVTLALTFLMLAVEALWHRLRRPRFDDAMLKRCLRSLSFVRNAEEAGLVVASVVGPALGVETALLVMRGEARLEPVPPRAGLGTVACKRHVLEALAGAIEASMGEPRDRRPLRPFVDAGYRFAVPVRRGSRFHGAIAFVSKRQLLTDEIDMVIYVADDVADKLSHFEADEAKRDQRREKAARKLESARA